MTRGQVQTLSFGLGGLGALCLCLLPLCLSGLCPLLRVPAAALASWWGAGVHRLGGLAGRCVGGGGVFGAAWPAFPVVVGRAAGLLLLDPLLRRG